MKNTAVMLLLALFMVVIAPTQVQAAETGANVVATKNSVTIRHSRGTAKLKKNTKHLHLSKSLPLYTSPSFAKKSCTVKKKTVKQIAKAKNFTVVKHGKKYLFAKAGNVKTLKAKKTWKQFKHSGVLNTFGRRWTWYSQKVLPGKGLKIPGRHVDKQTNCVCDKDGYIVLASSSLYKRGTIFKTPLGKWGKVYDRGVRGTHLDVYCNF